MPVLPLLLALAAPQATPRDAEWIGLRPIPGFVVGHRQRVPGGALTERVPAGETVHDWTRMVTVIRLERVPATPADYSRGLGERWTASCPGGSATRPVAVPLTPGDPVEARYDCPRNPQTGKAETMFMRVQRGADALHVVQVAFRRTASTADVQWARSILSGVWLCRRGMAPLACGPGNEGL